MYLRQQATFKDLLVGYKSLGFRNVTQCLDMAGKPVVGADDGCGSLPTPACFPSPALFVRQGCDAGKAVERAAEREETETEAHKFHR
jgi:hypothetical protein